MMTASSDSSSSSCNNLTRDIVIDVVNEYGKAWTTQNPNLLSTIFTPDAIYVERAFDRKATFIGLREIINYWKYQICGKQSSIKFYLVESELIIDSINPNIAVVKWLAEFHNFRYNRCGGSSGGGRGGGSGKSTKDKSNKKVRFCQMAKLIFRDNKIEYLEEYSQDMTGPGVCWPGIFDDTNDDNETNNSSRNIDDDNMLWKKIRFVKEKENEDQVKSTKESKSSTGNTTTTTTADTVSSSSSSVIIECNNCHTKFSSRTRLFKHIKQTEYQPSTDRCVPIAKEDIMICFSLSYCFIHLGINGNKRHQQQLLLIEKYIQQAFHSVIHNNNNNNNITDENSTEGELSSSTPIIWAVPIHLTSSAIVNVGTIKLLSLSSDIASEVKRKCENCNDLPKLLNKELSKSLKTKTTFSTTTGLVINIHSTGIVNRPCSPQRRECERYNVYIPWKLLRTTTDIETSTNDTINNQNIRDDNKIQATTTTTTEVETAAGDSEVESNIQLCSSSTTTTTIASDNNNNNKTRWRRPIEETIAYQYSGTTAIKRMKHASRLMKDYGMMILDDDVNDGVDKNNNNNFEQQHEYNSTKNKLRVRTSKMDVEPMYRYCKISLSMKALSTSSIENIIKLLIQYTRFDINDDNELITALQEQHQQPSLLPSSSSSSAKQSTTDTHEISTDKEEKENSPNSLQREEHKKEFNFADFVMLEEPSIANYEHKVKLGLTRSNTIHTSDDAKSSMDRAEKFLWMNQVVDEKQEMLLERWILSFLEKEDISE